MKSRTLKLCLLRHAKAIRDNVTPDFERPLASKGRQDIKAVAEQAAELDIGIKLILFSSSKRTTETALALAEIACPEAERVAAEELYGCTGSTLWEELAPFLTVFDSLVVVGHNPAISDLARMLGNKKHARDLKTSEFVVFEADIESGAAPHPSAFSRTARLSKPKS